MWNIHRLGWQHKAVSGRSPARLTADRVGVIIGLCGLIGLSWAYLFYQSWAMNHMDIGAMAMPSMGAWGPGDLLLIFSMWAIMMVAMMLPSAMPMILLYATISRKHAGQQKFFAYTWMFLFGYLAIWLGFSALATLGQWGLHAASLVSASMVTTSSMLGGTLLIAAGIYQWTPLKHACLAHCRSPLDYLMTGWRIGAKGAFRMGLAHGGYCTGCCWLLMALLFVAGVMNLMWIAILSIFVLAEKIMPKGFWLARGTGLLLMVWGVWMIAAMYGDLNL